MSEKKTSPRLGVGNKVLGLDFGKYLLGSENKREVMDSDNAAGAESDLSDWEFNQQLYAKQSMSENSEESDDFGMYSSDDVQMFDTVVDSGDRRRLDNRQYPDQLGVIRPGHQQLHSVVTQLNNSNNDSAYGGSGLLYPIQESGSQLSESSGEEDNNNSDGTLSGSGSPVHNPVYGRYQKFQTPASDNNDLSDDELDTLMLHRLPGENLGMILGIEGGKGGSGKVTSVTVKSVTLGGAAYRATGSSKGLCVGDEIIQVNTTDLRTLSHDECISVFKDMPLRVLLGVKRGQKDLPPVSISPLPSARPTPPSRMDGTSPRPVSVTRKRDISDSEEEGSGGFAVYHVTVEKDPDENLGLSIVPSYGSTKEYYQIKRILPSGAAAQTGLLHVGDRLISCNGTSLRGLTQQHCLSIIKTASSRGDVKFEVIRPVYNGSPMEISVTVNNNSTDIPSYDPQQFSLKSQSYDRTVDVVVTSESDDYLTISEDEYSKKRLADIPEVEANEVFATNSVKLAFQKPFNTIDEEITGTEDEDIPVTNVSELEDTEVVDLNRKDASPYHISKKSEQQNNSDLNTVPKTDIDNLTSASESEYSVQKLPRTEIDSVSLTTVSSLSPRSPIPSSDLDVVSTNYSKRQQVPRDTEERGISPPYNHTSESASQDIPVSDLDTVKYNPLYEDSCVSDLTDSEQAPDIYIASPSLNNKRQNVPFSDLDKISVNSNRSIPHTEIDKVSVSSNSGKEKSKESDSNLDQSNGEDEPLPPPVEFSDNIDNQESFSGKEDREIYLPYTNLDDIVQDSESTVDISPAHHHIEIVEREKATRQHLALEPSFRELERASDDKPYHLKELETESELAFNAELTAPFDSVLQDPSLCVQSSNLPYEYSDTVENEILQVVQSYDDGTIVISQFDPEHKRETTDSPSHFHPGIKYSDNIMDTNSEAMLKDALDMEYDQLADSSKMEKRVNLGVNLAADEHDFDDPSYRNDNVVAENIAVEIIKNEQGQNGYFLESDDEPDQYPDADDPGNVPDLPDEPPPILSAMPGMDQMLSGEVDFNHMNKPEKPDPEPVIVDSNWSFRTKVYVDGDTNNADADKDNGESDIVPLKKERKVEIPQKLYEVPKFDDDVIVPVSNERQQRMPSHFTPVEKQVTNIVLDDEDMFGYGIGQSAPKPAPRKNVVNINISDPYLEPEPVEDEVQEEVIEASDRKRDLNKNIVNVISVVNALKKATKNNDPDEVDKVVKEDVKDRLMNKVSTVIGVNGNKFKEMSPPKHEQIISEKDKINISVKRKPEPETPKEVKQAVINVDYQKPVEVSPPRHDVVEETIESVRKPASRTVLNISESPSKSESNQTKDTAVNSKPEKIDTAHKPEAKPSITTSIYVENQQAAKEPAKAPPVPAKREQPPKPNVPPPTLPKPAREKKDTVEPPTDSQTPDTAQTSTYKTTIGVTSKPEPTEKRALQPTPQIKPLSHIKPLSFNPKTLSQAKPVQYKTTISALGNRPSSGLSSLGKSSLLNPQKTQHPIKRMETLPFEVSILKGILGIGIKTAMTPEGYVKVSEILPNGPVGREGNIQVGDYLLSINNTPLTGLPDSKVQQILRLLPRGLSKIVASAVPPDGSQPQNAVEEKPQPSPTQKSAPHVQPASTVSVATKPTTLSTRPVPSLRSGIKVDTSPQISPRSPKSISPTLSPRKIESQIFSKLPKSSPTTSPAVSPRQQEPQQNSPRTPPTVAPKPKKPVQTPVEVVVEPVKSETIESAPPKYSERKRKDSNEPIETEVFVSINGSKEENVPTSHSGPSILPGSMNYDSIQTTDKTEWTQGVVSSTDIKSRDMAVGLSGKTDVVMADTPSQNDIDVNLTVEAPSVEISTKSENITESAPENDSDKQASVEAEKSAEEINETFEKLSQVETASAADVPTSRPRTFSASSESSSYTEFNECNVEDDIIPEQIEEEEAENVQQSFSGVQNQDKKEAKTEDYESDFDEEDEGETKATEQSIGADEDNIALRALAENIVTEVIDAVKEMNLEATANTDSGIEDQNSSSTPPPIPDIESPVIDDMPSSSETKSHPPPDEATLCNQMVNVAEDTRPPLPDEAPPLPADAPPLFDEAPPIPSEAPPLPSEAPPLPSEAPPVPAPVVDLTLYPDECDTEVKEDVVDQDTVSSSFKSPLHAASTPNVDIVNSQDNAANVDDLIIDNGFVPQQVTDTSKGQEEGNQSETVKEVETSESGDKNISDVIAMYADIEQKADSELNVIDKDTSNSLGSVKEAENNNNKKTESEIHLEIKQDITGQDEVESCDTKSLTSSEDFLSDADIVEAPATQSEVIVVVPNLDIASNESNSDKAAETEAADTKVNGHDKKVPTIELVSSRDIDEKTDSSLSPRSDSKYSPRSVDAFLSELDSPKQQFSPELDKMMRMFSTEEQPKHDGEGKILHLKMNRGVTGIGFVIQGGRGSPRGDLPISVKRIFKGGPADGLLQVGDEILEVAGEDVSHMRQTEARTHLKFLPSGDVNVTIRRYSEPAEDASLV